MKLWATRSPTTDSTASAGRVTTDRERLGVRASAVRRRVRVTRLPFVRPARDDERDVQRSFTKVSADGTATTITSPRGLKISLSREARPLARTLRWREAWTAFSYSAQS
jgi:hypothetical protein